MTELRERQSLQGVRASLCCDGRKRLQGRGKLGAYSRVDRPILIRIHSGKSDRTLSQQAQVKTEITSTNYWLLLSEHLRTSGMAGSRGLNSADRTLSPLSLPFSVLALFSGKWSPRGGGRAVDSSGLNLLSAEKRSFFK